MGFFLHDTNDKDEDEDDKDNKEEGKDNPPDDIQGEELEKDDPDYVQEVPVENCGLTSLSSLRHWTCSQQAKQSKSSLVEEILSDKDKSRKSKKEAEITCKEKVLESASKGGELESNLLSDQKDPEG